MLRSLIKQRFSFLFTYNFACVSMTVLLFTASRDWETVQNVVPGKSSSKLNQFGSEGKGAEQSSNA